MSDESRNVLVVTFEDSAGPVKVCVCVFVCTCVHVCACSVRACVRAVCVWEGWALKAFDPSTQMQHLCTFLVFRCKEVIKEEM